MRMVVSVTSSWGPADPAESELCRFGVVWLFLGTVGRGRSVRGVFVLQSSFSSASLAEERLGQTSAWPLQCFLG